MYKQLTAHRPAFSESELHTFKKVLQEADVLPYVLPCFTTAEYRNRKLRHLPLFSRSLTAMYWETITFNARARVITRKDVMNTENMDKINIALEDSCHLGCYAVKRVI